MARHAFAGSNYPSDFWIANDNPSLEQLLVSDISWVHGVIIVLIAIILIGCIGVYVLFRKRPSKQTILQLELTSGGECVIVPLIHLPLCPSYYKFTHPEIRDILVSEFPSFNLIAGHVICVCTK